MSDKPYSSESHSCAPSVESWDQNIPKLTCSRMNHHPMGLNEGTLRNSHFYF